MWLIAGPDCTAEGVDNPSPPRTHRLSYIFQVLAVPYHRKESSSLPRNLPISVIGHADAARLRDAFQPRRDIHAVAQDVVAIDQHCHPN